jgi:hypothetical protein
MKRSAARQNAMVGVAKAVGPAVKKAVGPAVEKAAGPPPDPPTKEEAAAEPEPVAAPVEPPAGKATVTTKAYRKADRPAADEALQKQAPAEVPKVRTVTGHVYDPQGRPLAGVQLGFVLDVAEVAAAPGGPYRPMTDRDGLFLFPDVPRRPLRITLSRAGYRYESVDLPADRDEVDWTFGLVRDPKDRGQPAPSRDEPIPPELRGRLTFVDLDRRGTDDLADGPGLGGNDLSALPRGIHKLGDTYFRIGEEMIHVQGQMRADLPQSVKGIEVRARGEILHFLHAVQYGVESSELIGAYVIRYADGTSERIPLVCGGNFHDWWSFDSSPREATGAKIAWTGSNESTGMNKGIKLHLFDLAWTNPHPEKEIASLDVLSAGKQPDPFLVAVTVQRDR